MSQQLLATSHQQFSKQLTAIFFTNKRYLILQLFKLMGLQVERLRATPFTTTDNVFLKNIPERKQRASTIQPYLPRKDCPDNAATVVPLQLPPESSPSICLQVNLVPGNSLNMQQYQQENLASLPEELTGRKKRKKNTQKTFLNTPHIQLMKHSTLTILRELFPLLGVIWHQLQLEI